MGKPDITTKSGAMENTASLMKIRRLHNLFLAQLYRFNRENYPHDDSAECWAAINNQLDVMKKVNELTVWHETGGSLFFHTVREESIEVLEFLLDSNHPEVPSLDHVFIMAVADRKIKVMRYLLDRGVDVNRAQDSRGYTAIFLAARADYPDVMTILIENGANVEDRNATGWSPLGWALWRSRLEVSKVLIENGADINAKGVGGRCSVLHEAAVHGDISRVRFYLQNGANPFLKFHEGKTALHMAALNGYSGVVHCILNHVGPDQISITDDRFASTPLHIAVAASHVETTETLINWSNVSALNYEDGNGRTAMFLAARFNRRDILELLLEANADPNIRDRWGASPIFAAVRNNQMDAVKYLMEVLGAKCFDERDDFGHGIVWWATRTGKPDMLRFLTKCARESESDVEIEASEYFAEERIIRHNLETCWCDICTRSIGGLRNGYQCTCCFDKNFVICKDCFDEGQVTCELGHREEKWIPFTDCGCRTYDRP